MKRKIRDIRLAIFTMSAFWLAAIVNIWRLIDEGPGTAILIGAILFPFAAIVWTIVVINFRKQGIKEE